MLSRALSLATVTLLIGCFAADPALAQTQNLEAGKSPSQIFAGTCTACHKGPRGLLKTVPAGSLQGYLKQHYTTSPEMASLLAAFPRHSERVFHGFRLIEASASARVRLDPATLGADALFAGAPRQPPSPSIR